MAPKGWIHSECFCTESAPTGRRTEMRRLSRQTPPSHAAAPDCRGFSPEPPVPVQELIAEEESENGHAAEKDAKRHLVKAQDHLCRLPSAAASRLGIRQVLGETMRTLEKNYEDRKHAEERSRERREIGRAH